MSGGEVWLRTGAGEVWERTGELRWFPHPNLPGEHALYQAWSSERDGRLEWEMVQYATADEIDALAEQEQEGKG